MLGPAITLLLLTLALAWSVIFKAGVWPQDWDVTLCAIGLISVGYWLFTRPIHRAPPLSRWLRWPLFLLPSYLAFQLIPLPLAVLEVLSPARAQLIKTLAPVTGDITWAPLSVNPPAALLAVFTLVSCIAAFFLVRELAWRWTNRPWIPLIPLVTIAVLEAAIGMSQVFSRWPSGEATGTYTNRDHFAGLLEMLLPIAALQGVAILGRRKEHFRSPALPAIRACILWTLAALLLLAIVYSLSRMGFIAALSALFLVAAIGIAPRGLSRAWRFSSLGLMAATILFVLIFLPPQQLVERFAAISSTGTASTNTRLFLWKETPRLISEFPLFGTGLGGFESTFLKYQDVDNALRIEFAHNDYLQYLAELGLIGFALLAAIVAGIAAQVFRGILKSSEGDRRFLLTGCAAALAAMLLHSFVDFNMHIPANALIFTWIAAVASMNASTGFAAMTPRPARRRHPVSSHDQKRHDQKSAAAG